MNGVRILSVNHDNWGTAVTYVGYLLLLAGMLLTLFDSKSRFRRLAMQLRQTLPLLLFCSFPLPLAAQDGATHCLHENTIPADHAEVWGRMQVQCSTGRIEPVNTYTSKLLRKLYRDDSFGGLCSEQVILGFLINPAYWGNVPLIRQSNTELAEKLALPSDKYLRFFDLFDEEGRYVIAEAVDSAYSHPAAKRSRMEKDLLKLDEKVNILYSLQQGGMFALFLCRTARKESGIRPVTICPHSPVRIRCLSPKFFIGIRKRLVMLCRHKTGLQLTKCFP